MLDQVSEGIDLTVRIDISRSLLEAVDLIPSHIMDTAFMTTDIVISKNVIVSHDQRSDSGSYQLQTDLETAGSET